GGGYQPQPQQGGQQQQQQQQQQQPQQPQQQQQQGGQGGVAPATFSYVGAPAGGAAPMQQQPMVAQAYPVQQQPQTYGGAGAGGAMAGGAGAGAQRAPLIQEGGQEGGQGGEEAPPAHTSGRRLLGATTEVQRVPMTTSNSYIYYAQLGVGTPRQNDIHVILDTGSSVFAIFAVPHGGPTLLVICLLVAACLLGATSIGLLALSWYQGEYEDEPQGQGERDLPSKA
ncbi:hypothetical protein T484DRAFT_1808678, partial [Baffinella frigidus]